MRRGHINNIMCRNLTSCSIISLETSKVMQNFGLAGFKNLCEEPYYNVVEQAAI